MTPIGILRDATARRTAIETYERHYEHFAQSAQLYAGTSLSKTVGDVAVLFLLAADAERTDPEPRQSPVMVCCAMCAVYRASPAKGPHPLS